MAQMNKEKKQYPVVITTIGDAGVSTDLLSVPVLDLDHASTGHNIFKLLEEMKVPPPKNAPLVGDPPQPPEPAVPWENCLALGCDNAAVMTSHTNSVYGHMITKQKNLYLAGCPCHLIHRAAQKAASVLPFSIDEILVDVYYYFEHSSKRLAALEAFQGEVKHQKMLKHVATRWLSVRKCLDRLLENWDALRKFFKEEAPAATSTSRAEGREKRLKSFFQSPTNKLYCLFLKQALEPFDIVNKQLQAESPQIHCLQRSLLDLLRQLIVKFVKPIVIAEKTKVTEEMQMRQKTPLEINFRDLQNHKSQVLLSEEAAEFLRKKDEVGLQESRIKEFHATSKQFYVTACNYLRAKFPLSSEVLKNAEVADVDQRLEVTEEQLCFFMNRYPCLVPSGSSVDTVKNAFATYQSQPVVPSLRKERMDTTWVAIGQTKDAAGVPMFSNVAKVMLGILTIPHSNAGCERVFSCVRKNRTDQRASLSAKTLDSLMVVKSRPGMPADRTYSTKELSDLKSAYYQSLNKQ